MKLHLAITIFFLNAFAYAQIQERPAEFKKIKFVYETTSNYIVENQRVYADTLLFRENFPNLKWSQQLNKDGNTSFYVPVANFTSEQITRLKSILYHENQTFFGEYDKEKDKTVFRVIRDDKATRKIFREVFNESYYKFRYKIEIDYKKGTYDHYYPRVNYSRSTAEHLNAIVFQNDTVGMFKKTILNRISKNIVLLDSKLDAKIMPEELFSNNTYGVKMIKNLHSTTVLKSVEYTD
jgi:hypothetical protein